MAEKRRKRAEWSRRSARDLLSIESFIARDNPVAADEVISEIVGKALLLEVDAALGKRSRSGHRELVLTRFPFTIIYRVAPKTVLISRVLHQRRRFPK